VTCRVCTAPVDGHRLCWRCRTHREHAGLADLVVPLIYATGDTSSGSMLLGYKNHPVRSVRAAHSAVIEALLREAITAHERCVDVVVGAPVMARVVVPSLTSRPGAHPMAAIARSIGLVRQGVELSPALDARCDRVVRSDKFCVLGRDAVVGRHVLVIDDVWTTGANAQSAALTLRRAGASAVSVLTVGRWLNPNHPATAGFIRKRLTGPAAAVCPVTGAQCPPR
jgi:predicted amidophosphoribosyltransferase